MRKLTGKLIGKLTATRRQHAAEFNASKLHTSRARAVATGVRQWAHSLRIKRA